jgi:hypothetical protein
MIKFVEKINNGRYFDTKGVHAINKSLATAATNE